MGVLLRPGEDPRPWRRRIDMPNKMIRPGRGGARHGARNATSSARNSPSCPTTTRIDFEAINQAALPLLMRMLFRWLPGGRVQGREYIVRNLTRTTAHPAPSRSWCRARARAPAKIFGRAEDPFRSLFQEVQRTFEDFSRRTPPNCNQRVTGAGAYTATCAVTHPRQEPYAGKPHVRICAGGVR